MNVRESNYTFVASYPGESRDEVIVHLNALVAVARRLRTKNACIFRFGVQAVRAKDKGLPGYAGPKNAGNKLSYPVDDESVDYYVIRVIISGKKACSCCDHLIKRAGKGRKCRVEEVDMLPLLVDWSEKSIQRRKV